MTRPAGDRDDLVAALRRSGASVAVAPAIGFGPPDDGSAADDAVLHLQRYAWLMLTSVHGVEAFYARARAAGVTPARNLRIAAVGPKTAAAVEAFGGHVALIPEAFSGDDVARSIVDAGAEDDRILLFRAQEGSDEAAGRLRAAGRRVDVVAGYKTVFLHGDALCREARDADVITFASGSAARATAQNIDPGDPVIRSKTIACIGRASAQAAERCGFRVDVVADESTAEGLVRAIESYFTRAAR